MNPRIPEEGLIDQLYSRLHPEALAVVGWDLMLFTDELEEIPAGIVIGDLTEATFTGYMRKTLDQDGWSGPVIVGERAESVWGTQPVAWLCSGAPQTITGSALFDPISERLQLVQLFTPPIVLAPGGRVEVIPRFSDTNEVIE